MKTKERMKKLIFQWDKKIIDFVGKCIWKSR